MSATRDSAHGRLQWYLMEARLGGEINELGKEGEAISTKLQLKNLDGCWDTTIPDGDSDTDGDGDEEEKWKAKLGGSEKGFAQAKGMGGYSAKRRLGDVSTTVVGTPDWPFISSLSLTNKDSISPQYLEPRKEFSAVLAALD
jgi:hypothetical protein